jgi:hypothetical protein
VTDEDAFGALADLRSAVTVHVGSAGADSLARYSVETPAQVHELLSLLLHARS